MATSRRLSAIMFTDMVGSTEAAQANERAALKLRERQEAILRPLFRSHQGREVKSLGDGFMVEFESALDAVQSAIDIQRALHEANRLAPQEARIWIRIGIHLGDVVHTGDDLFGDSVNIAARIQPMAEPGGICISDPVFGQVRNKIPNSLHRLEPKLLKGVTFPIEIYRVALPWEVADRRANPIGVARLAVLPFVNMSPDSRDEFFADGLTEELIGRLSEVPGLRVIARTSVMSYKRKEKRLGEIGAELGVQTLIEGSVRRSGNRIRVTVQLVDARSEEHVWASKYDAELDDIFDIQTDVASRVANALEHGFFASSPRKETTDVGAYTAYLRALQLLHEGTESSVRESRSLLDHALAQDPNFARAYAARARLTCLLVTQGREEWDLIAQVAEVAARKALELDPDSAEAHAALAEVLGMLDRFELSTAEAERAIAINPNLSEAYDTLGRYYSMLGNLDKGLLAFRKALELDPMAVATGLILAWVAQLAGEEAEARQVLERFGRLSPRDPRVFDGLGEFYRLKGDYPKAQETYDSGLATDPGNLDLRVDLGVLLALQGRRGEAERALWDAEPLLNGAGRQNARLYIYAALGDLDRAFDALSHLAETHTWPFLIAVHPLFKGMQGDPRFVTFRLRVGLGP